MSASRKNNGLDDPGISNKAPLRNYEIAEQRGHEYHHDYDLHVGAEPGVNPLSGRSKAEYNHFKQDCVIDIIDYECDDIKFRRFSNEGLINLMKKSDPREHLDDMQKPLPAHVVRWINIGGIDWAVLSAVAVRYKLHSLALEDILHEQGHNHSKADYYAGHLFIRILSHTVDLTEPEDNDEDFDLSAAHAPHNRHVPESQPTGMDLEEGGYVPLENVKDKPIVKYAPEIVTPFLQASNSDDTTNSNDKKHVLRLPRGFPSPLKKRISGLSGFGGLSRESRNKAIEILKKGDRVAVKHEPMFIFLFPDGTVISIRNTPSLEFTQPIKERLHLPDSILRVSEDASLLVEALLDLVVDRILEVVDEYQVKLSKLEHDILLRPAMRSVRSLHILSGDLILEKRTLDPVRMMIYGLRNNDLQRCQALADSLAKENRNQHKDKATGAKKEETLQPQDPVVQADAGNNAAPQLVPGYFSFKSKVYLADVADHMDFALTSLDMFSAMSENLLNFAFNTASYDMNIVINRLTTTSIVFLPLTLLTGYFGMNFTAFWSINNNSDLFYWELAIPIMIVLIPMLMYKDVKNFIQYLIRREDSRRAAKQVRTRQKRD